MQQYLTGVVASALQPVAPDLEDDVCQVNSAIVKPWMADLNQLIDIRVDGYVLLNRHSREYGDLELHFLGGGRRQDLQSLHRDGGSF
ncbi:MAG: hypothetical protein QGI49_11765 [SAR202 cluster bacterium]|nr:hypothetical protein [SAR202 cluster bacterium]